MSLNHTEEIRGKMQNIDDLTGSKLYKLWAIMTGADPKEHERDCSPVKSNKLY